eukprot:NODE_5287_length_674_cov_20.394881_g5124_i0.p1 GENE.NODE_5287_length_674_cov_20.394881_g5124_i0~~NODE_5287_length_674_cov_20.394881_g5124_i0.p1  ORF type:complete len:212 (+),score=60.06 NODE_5287_length_674_cov_20.394881_g5124_i0:30-665(+)
MLTRRLLPGMRTADLYDWGEATPQSLSQPLALQEYLQQLLRDNPSDIAALLKAPAGLEARWQYEHMRVLVQQLNQFVVRFFEVCTPASCPKMKATDEWLFLCACHKVPQECSAMDYSLHTIDGAATVLNSQRYFADRANIEAGKESFQLFSNMLRRLYRIFAHTYYHHREEFEAFENEHFLCERFVRFALTHKLIQRKHLIIPVGCPNEDP